MIPQLLILFVKFNQLLHLLVSSFIFFFCFHATSNILFYVGERLKILPFRFLSILFFSYFSDQPCTETVKNSF